MIYTSALMVDFNFVPELIKIHVWFCRFFNIWTFHNFLCCVLLLWLNPSGQTSWMSKLTYQVKNSSIKVRARVNWLIPDQFQFDSDLMNQCQLILFIRRPSCLVADSASDTLTAVCPNTPRPLLLAGLAGEYYWMSIWPHYKCVAMGNQLGEEGGGGGGG